MLSAATYVVGGFVDVSVMTVVADVMWSDFPVGVIAAGAALSSGRGSGHPG